ncbi:hypothetical protein [Bradyrhizobium erythrophlei]|uniref:Uncharacterized protein n=1 Tax=Bradyrhizobium erythrophlei TaxID=1437360 RepID=A0A1M5MQ43_9BRAD|nr:hypothetical protein [Bradyrhizobium erythrophlei]SHG79418.1 hypothetical protein SAMN05443248_2678 [Bradyrhizobium erythrophlei]
MSVALLAPIPEEHLVSGIETLSHAGKVAFGSKSWEVFNKVDAILAGGECDVLIYVSDAVRPISPPTVTWSARYLGSSLAINGAHKDGMKYRPATTDNYPSDNKGHWVLFWEVDNLRRLQSPIKISQVRGFEKPQRYLTGFIPRGPMLIQAQDIA